jgi:hypothetical protein
MKEKNENNNSKEGGGAVEKQFLAPRENAKNN